MDEMDVAEIMRRISRGRGIITPDQAIAYQEAEINKYRARIDSMETEIKARAEHIRILEERLQKAEEQEHMIGKLSRQNEEYREDIRKLKRELQQYQIGPKCTGTVILPDNSGTVITVNRTNIDNVEIYFKEGKGE